MRKLFARFLQQLTERNAPFQTQAWYANLLAAWFDVADPTVNAATVSAKTFNSGGIKKTILTLTATPVTLVKDGTTTGGGGTKLITFPAGMILPLVGSSDLAIAAAGDKSFLASVGSAAADDGGTLATTEISFLPSTAATTSSGVGTCKMKSTAVAPVVGAPLDGTSTAIPLFLNACLNADATGVEALTFTGTITILWGHGGDN